MVSLSNCEIQKAKICILESDIVKCEDNLQPETETHSPKITEKQYPTNQRGQIQIDYTYAKNSKFRENMISINYKEKFYGYVISKKKNRILLITFATTAPENLQFPVVS